jgi:hypothetical protein
MQKKKKLPLMPVNSRTNVSTTSSSDDEFSDRSLVVPKPSPVNTAIMSSASSYMDNGLKSFFFKEYFEALECF